MFTRLYHIFIRRKWSENICRTKIVKKLKFETEISNHIFSGEQTGGRDRQRTECDSQICARQILETIPRARVTGWRLAIFVFTFL